MTVLPNRQKQSSSHAGHWAELDTFQVFLPQGISVAGRQRVQRCASQVVLLVCLRPASAGGHKRCAFDPWVREDLEKGMTTHSVLPGKLHAQRSLAGYSLIVHGRKESFHNTESPC